VRKLQESFVFIQSNPMPMYSDVLTSSRLGVEFHLHD
jgi:hypothetical protein